MGIHISLLGILDNVAKIALHITFGRSIIFEQEIDLPVGQMFNLNNIKIEMNNPEHNKYGDIKFSDN